MNRKRAQPDHRADTRGGRFAGIPHVVLDSAAYRSLSLTARAILVELIRKFDGYNNGTIGLSQRQIADALNLTNFRKIGPATAELMNCGLIVVVAEGQWKARQARLFRLTFVSTGKPGHERKATNEYIGWQPPVTRTPAANVATAKPRSAANVATGAGFAVANVAAAVSQEWRKSVGLRDFG